MHILRFICIIVEDPTNCSNVILNEKKPTQNEELRENLEAVTQNGQGTYLMCYYSFKQDNENKT
jgi:hypothetical protein